jgi:hypothetical protein
VLADVRADYPGHEGIEQSAGEQEDMIGGADEAPVKLRRR